MSDRRITKQTESMLAILLTKPHGEWWGTQIGRAAGLKSGTIYPALARMERFGWLTSRWEDVEPVVEARPRRRLYRLTREGELAAREIVSRVRARPRQSGESRLRPVSDAV